MGTDTRDAIVRTAARLFQTRGYNGFSYAHIAEALGVKPAAIHYHFRGKSDLGVAVAERFRERWRRFCASAASASPQDRLLALHDVYLRLAERRLSCPIAVVHAELDAVPEPVRASAIEVLEECVTWLEEALEAGRAAGDFRFEGEARARALVLLSLAQGSLQLARTQGLEVFNATRERLVADLVGATKEDA
ncbi:MAG: TetR/AcrR family transcriptional regulator [Myxococcota bacterium]